VELELSNLQLWMIRAGAKNSWIGEPELEVWVSIPQTWFVGQTSCKNKHKYFYVLMDKIVVEPEPKTSRCWSQSQKILVAGAGSRA